MTPRTMTRVASVFLAASLVLPAGIALAAGPASPAGPAKPPSGAAAGPPEEGAMKARVEQRIANLHAQLHITPTEELQWREFASVMRDNAEKMDERAAERAAKFPSLSAVENLKSYADMAVEHGQNAQKLAAAFSSLYQMMSPEQKKVADDVFRGRTEQRLKRQQR